MKSRFKREERFKEGLSLFFRHDLKVFDPRATWIVVVQNQKFPAFLNPRNLFNHRNGLRFKFATDTVHHFGAGVERIPVQIQKSGVLASDLILRVTVDNDKESVSVGFDPESPDKGLSAPENQ
jgi:hypothetical protein